MDYFPYNVPKNSQLYGCIDNLIKFSLMLSVNTPTFKVTISEGFKLVMSKFIYDP